MKDETAVTDALMRQYLLGNVGDEERQRIESLFLTDSTMRERLLATEQDLIEDYLEDSLTTADKERFRLHFAQAPNQQRKLRITKSIKDWAVTEASSTQPIPAKVTDGSGIRVLRWKKSVFVVPVAVAIIVAIVVAAVWLNNRNKRLAIEQELAQLNTPASLREVPSQMVSRDLAPGTVRSSQQEIEIKKGDDIRIVELRLPWVQTERYSRYQAEVRPINGDESFTLRDLQAEDNGRSDAVRIRIPAHLLHRGHYQILLSGIAPDGAAGPAEEYTFAVDG
jgi:hypothetical protein